MAYFFEGGLDDAEPSDVTSLGNEQSVGSFLITSEGVELAQSFPAIKDPKARRKVFEFVKALAED